MHTSTSFKDTGFGTVLKTGLAALSMVFVMPLASHASADGKASEAALATIEVSASKEVLQDQARVVFAAQASGSSAAEVNRKLSEALSQARANFSVPAGVELSTGGFNVYLSYGKDNKPSGWVGRASLVLEGTNLESVSAAIEHLGKSLAIQSVQFSLSRQARRDQEKSLMQDLAQALKQRAALTTQAFGFKGYEIVSLDFTGNGVMARPVMQRMAAVPMADGAGPSVTLEPSMVTVEISVTGQIRLQ